MLRPYEDRLQIIRRAAYGLGYAIGLHGSGESDLDLIAVPWTEQAASAEELVEEIRSEIDGVIVIVENADPFYYRNPQPKPHGRMAWSIQIGRGLYVDLSVMPLATSYRNSHLPRRL